MQQGFFGAHRAEVFAAAAFSGEPQNVVIRERA